MKILAMTILFTGVFVECCCCAGLFLSRTVYARIHFLSIASIIGPVLIAAAVIITEGFSQAGIKAILIALILAILSPILAHTTARMAFFRQMQGKQGRVPHDS